MLQVIVILEIVVAVGLIASGRIPAPGAAEWLAVLAIFLLGLPPLVLTWLMFEVNRPDRGWSVNENEPPIHQTGVIDSDFSGDHHLMIVKKSTQKS